jgi:hypothetical protein
VRGRHRGLPLAIDRSILLPGEELMRRMDAEYSELGAYNPEDVEELREDIEQSGRLQPGSKEVKQNPEKGNEEHEGGHI